MTRNQARQRMLEAAEAMEKAKLLNTEIWECAFAIDPKKAEKWPFIEWTTQRIRAFLKAVGEKK